MKIFHGIDKNLQHFTGINGKPLGFFYVELGGTWGQTLIFYFIGKIDGLKLSEG